MGRGKFDQKCTGEGSLGDPYQLVVHGTCTKIDALKVATSWYRIPQRNMSTDICALEHSIANVL